MTTTPEARGGRYSIEAPESKQRKTAYSIGEEIANAITHGIGAPLSVAALALMVAFAAMRGDPWRIVSCSIFGSTLILLYSFSTLYHSMPASRAKRVFKVLDHAGIYLLIAGTYTPFTLVSLRGPWGWSLFGTVWGLAIVGILFEAFWLDRPKWLSAVVFIAMGWIVVVAMRPLLATLPVAGLRLLVAGGIVYTVGTVFYVMKKVPYMHAFWHLWVLGGSVCHVLAVLLGVVNHPGPL